VAATLADHPIQFGDPVGAFPRLPVQLAFDQREFFVLGEFRVVEDPLDERVALGGGPLRRWFGGG
jgi:hypothetical protein